MRKNKQIHNFLGGDTIFGTVFDLAVNNYQKFEIPCIRTTPAWAGFRYFGTKNCTAEKFMNS